MINGISKKRSLLQVIWGEYWAGIALLLFVIGVVFYSYGMSLVLLYLSYGLLGMFMFYVLYYCYSTCRLRKFQHEFILKNCDTINSLSDFYIRFLQDLGEAGITKSGQYKLCRPLLGIILFSEDINVFIHLNFIHLNFGAPYIRLDELLANSKTIIEKQVELEGKYENN